jgi:hypothetical protein
MANKATNIGTYHLAQNPELYEPARSNNFEFVVVGLPEKLLYAGVETTDKVSDDKKYIKNAQEVLRVSVLSSSVPHFSLSKIEVKRGNNTMKVAGVPTFDSGTLVCNDYIGARTKDILEAWKALAYDVRSELIQKMSKYKMEAYLIEYSPDYEEIRRWHMYGCWCSDVSESEFSNESNDKRTVTATIEYDYAIPEMAD